MVKICAIAEAAGISVIPHASALWPYALHACYALPAIPWAEYVALGAAGVPLDQLVSLPGTPMPGTACVSSYKRNALPHPISRTLSPA